MLMTNGNSPEENPPDIEQVLRELEMQRLAHAPLRNNATRAQRRVIAISILLFLLVLLMAGLYLMAEMLEGQTARPSPALQADQP